MRRILSGLLAAALVPGLAAAQGAPEGPPAAEGAAAPSAALSPTLASPAPAVLLAQLDDRDLADEESLEELMEIEYKASALSMGAGVGLSMLPGGGWGLLYAGKRAQAAVPFAMAAAGFVVGALYAVGQFDTSSKDVCNHVVAGTVPFVECSLGNGPPTNTQRDPRADYPGQNLSEVNQIYANTKADYERRTVGQDFDGTRTGLMIIGATYAVTSVLGAVWAGASISAHNERIRRDVESTASMPRPSLTYDGQQGSVGLTFDF